MSIMFSTRRRAAVGFAFPLLLAFLAPPLDVFAQAWVPAKGEGSIAVAFQSMNVKQHLATTTRINAGEIDTNVMLTDFTYGVTDKLAVDLSLPFVTSKYTGDRPHPGTNIDDGTYRGTVTDVRFSMRYNLTRDNVVITPYIGTIVPSHNYAFYGHAAPGQRLRELRVGVYAAKLFERGIPGLFVSGRYAYGFLEKVLNISHNRSGADLEVGYFFTSALRAFAIAHSQYSHGGIDFPTNGLAGVPPDYRLNHDQIQRVHALDLGAGAAYSISDSLDIFGSFARLVAGRNGHALNRGITVGASWSFKHKQPSSDGTAPSQPTAPAAATTKREGSLVKCICQKSGM